MHAERCKYTSNRKVQRMCRDGVIDCYKLQTTRNGQPVSEWLVNDTSLRKHIEENEIKWDGDHVTLPPTCGTASLVPFDNGDATVQSRKHKSAAEMPNAVSKTSQTGDASGGANAEQGRENVGDAMAPPRDNGNAIGETRSLASVLVENAKLTAELEGARQLVAEVRDDREFLREELKEARAGRKDVTAIAERMLETLETIAIGGKLLPPNPNDPGKAAFVERSEADAPHETVSNSHREVQAPSIGDNQADEIDQFGV